MTDRGLKVLAAVLSNLAAAGAGLGGAALAGGKARALAALIQAGHRVPRGLVLLPPAFVDDLLSGDVGEWLHRELKAFPQGQLFAVRSSALAEDSATASFAGAYESVLDVPASGLADAIGRVRGSRKAERVAA